MESIRILRNSIIALSRRRMEDQFQFKIMQKREFSRILNRRITRLGSMCLRGNKIEIVRGGGTYLH